MSQGESFEELQEQLKDIYQELTFGKHSVAGDQKLKRANSPANPGTACRPAEKRSPAGDSSQTDGDVLFPFIPANSCTPDVARQLAQCPGQQVSLWEAAWGGPFGQGISTCTESETPWTGRTETCP